MNPGRKSEEKTLEINDLNDTNYYRKALNKIKNGRGRSAKKGHGNNMTAYHNTPKFLALLFVVAFAGAAAAADGFTTIADAVDSSYVNYNRAGSSSALAVPRPANPSSTSLVDEREFYEDRRNIGEPGTPQAERAQSFTPSSGDPSATSLVDEREFYEDRRNIGEPGSPAYNASRNFTPSVGGDSSTSLIDEREFYEDNRNTRQR